MFKIKKLMALCATTLASISALGNFAPLSTFADAAKNGNTTVILEAPKPADWGLSVPDTIKLNKTSDPADAAAWGVGKLEIINEDGSSFTDSTKVRTFKIDGTSQFNGNNQMLLADSTHSQLLSLYFYAYAQGTPEPTKTSNMDSPDPNTLKNIEISSSVDGSKKAFRYITFAVYENILDKITHDCSNTIAWTATEKTS